MILVIRVISLQMQSKLAEHIKVLQPDSHYMNYLDESTAQYIIKFGQLRI